MPSYKHQYKPRLDEVRNSVPNERDKEYKHSIVRSSDKEFTPILQHIEGSKWIVDYYSQMKGSDEEPVPFDYEATTSNQQYHLIYNLDLRLQSQDMETEDKTNRIGMRGTATVYTGVIPNFGDVIISDIGAGLAARSTVTSVTKKSYMKDTVYEIEFEMMEYLDTKGKVDRINHYVVKESVFNEDLVAYGTDPLITKLDYDYYLNAEEVRTELIDDYLKEFFSNELSSFIVPEYDKPTYDPYVVEAFKSVVDGAEHPLMDRLKTLNVNEIKDAYRFSIWAVLLDPSINKIKNIWRRVGPVSHKNFNINPFMNSFRYSGYTYCLSPVEDLSNVDYYHGWHKLSKVGNGLFTNTLMGATFTNMYGPVIGEQLMKEVAKSKKLCCHHLIYYHSAFPRAIPTNSSTWMDTVHTWLRATGHLDACNHCGGCEECCCCHNCDKNNEDDEDKYSYVLPSSFWEKDRIDDLFSSMVRRYIKGERINLKEIIDYIEDRESLTPKQRFYRMLVMLIILTANMRSL